MIVTEIKGGLLFNLDGFSFSFFGLLMLHCRFADEKGILFIMYMEWVEVGEHGNRTE